MSSAAALLKRLPTGVSGLDLVMRGGFVVGDSYLVAGTPGTGKTTFGNQLAFAHVARGERAIFATLLAESHDRMIAHLRQFSFFDEQLIGDRLSYVSLLESLESSGLDGMLAEVRRIVRASRATLLVIDGTAVAEDLAPSPFAYRRFMQQLQVQSALANCTTILLSNRVAEAVDPIATHVDGIVLFRRDRAEHRSLRTIEIAKLRGVDHLLGRHDLAIAPEGITVYPRIEAALVGTPEPRDGTTGRVAFGSPAIDAMVNGGLLPESTTVLVGSPGVGKTILALQFAAEGVARGERVLFAGFREATPALTATAQGIGLDLASAIANDQLRILWQAPLELSPDSWTWRLIEHVQTFRPHRLIVDSFSDLNRSLHESGRQPDFEFALANYLRSQGVTSLFLVELNAIAVSSLSMPLPVTSPAFDNAILLRTVESHSHLQRLISILKIRQSAFDPAIRSFTIGERGIEVGEVASNELVRAQGTEKLVASRSQAEQSADAMTATERASL